MALTYHREDDMDSSSIFPSKSGNVEDAACAKPVTGDGTAGLRLARAGSSQTPQGDGTQPGERAAQSGDCRAKQLASRVSSRIPTWDKEGKKSPRSLAPGEIGELPFPLRRAPSSNPHLLLCNQKAFPIAPASQKE